MNGRGIAVLMAGLLGAAPAVMAAQPNAGADALQPAAARALFTPPARTPALSKARERAVVQSRYVGIDFEALAAAAGAGQPLALSLFEGKPLLAAVEAGRPSPRGGRTYTGSFKGGSLTLVVEQGVAAGSIVTASGAYQIGYAGQGVHFLRKLDLSRLPPGGEPLPVEPLADAKALDPGVAADAGDQIDLLVLWTPAARAAAGGTEAIRSLIQLGVHETNLAYLYSDVVQRVRLVHMEEVSYSEFYTEADLARLQDPFDGLLDEVHALRNTYGADMVQLVEENPYGPYCGMAYVMGPGHYAAFEAYAFSVTERRCISPSYTFAHELGHNMGSCHEPAGSSGACAFDYSYAYQDPANYFRTVMARDCPGGGCVRLLNFSNPNKFFLGRPMGTTYQDNHRSLNDTRVTVANWRQEVFKIDALEPVSGAVGGETSRLWALVRNDGPDPLPAGTDVWFWVGGTVQGYVGSASVAGLEPGTAAWYFFDYTLPLEAAGAYDYYAEVWTDNSTLQVSARAGPEPFAVGPATEVTSTSPVSGAQPGGSALLWAEVRNNGSTALPADAQVWFWVSGLDYPWVGSVPVGGLAPGDTQWFAYEWPIPAGQPIGSYTYWAQVWTSVAISPWSTAQDFVIE